MRQAAIIMTKLSKLSLLAIGTAVVLATSSPRDFDGVTDSWIIFNVFDGQTAVPEDIEIALTLGARDFQAEGGSSGARARRAFENIRLYPEGDPTDRVEIDFDIAEEETTLRFDPLEPDTWYVLDLTELSGSLSTGRSIPDPIVFRTGSNPNVVGVYRNEETLFIVFSEPMDSDTLNLSHDAVDILWQEENELHSIVYDLNLADFSYDAEGHIFRLAPVRFLEEVWIKVSGNVRGKSGVYLDGNGNGVAGEVGDDYIAPADIQSLEICMTREDIPDPCVPPDGLLYSDEVGW